MRGEEEQVDPIRRAFVHLWKQAEWHLWNGDTNCTSHDIKKSATRIPHATTFHRVFEYIPVAETQIIFYLNSNVRRVIWSINEISIMQRFSNVHSISSSSCVSSSRCIHVRIVAMGELFPYGLPWSDFPCVLSLLLTLPMPAASHCAHLGPSDTFSQCASLGLVPNILLVEYFLHF